MPFDNVRNLKQSALFDRMRTLQTMSDTKLRRFVTVYNRVFERVQRNGGTEDEAESTAIPLALSAARRASIVNQRVEDQVHFVAAHMPEQMAGRRGGFEADEIDFGLVKEMPDLVDEAVSGNLFFHGHGGPAVGVIRGITSREDAPKEVREKTDPDTPFLYRASYFEDTAEAVREMKGVSGEWGSIPLDNGKRLAMPGTFVVTDHPLNPPFTGIRMVAGHDEEPDDDLVVPSVNLRRLYSQEAGMEEPMTENPDIEGLSPEEMAEQLEETQAALAELKEEREEREGRFEEVQAGLKRLASLEKALGKEPDVQGSVDERIASLESTVKEALDEKQEYQESIASLQEDLASLKEEKELSEARDWTEENLAGKVPTSEFDEWAALRVENPDRAEKMAAAIPNTLLKGDEPTGDGLPEEDKASLDDKLDEALGIKEVEA